MARSHEAILAAAAVGLVSAAVGAGLKRRSGRDKKRRQAERRRLQQSPDVLVEKLFGDEKSMKVVINAYGDSHTAADAAAADRETFSALLQLLALVLAAFACTCFMAVAVATGSFLLLFGSLGVAHFIAAPAAVGVRRHWGRALDEALDESIKTTGVPWDLAVI